MEEIRKRIEPIIRENGYILDSVEYVKEGKTNSLVVVIDKDNITVEDCVIVSNLINPIIDEIDIIKESYILDVCTKERGKEDEH